MLSIEYCSSRCFYICYVTLILPRLFQSYTYHCRRNVRMERRSNLQIALSFRLGNSMIHFRWAREDIFLGEKKKKEKHERKIKVKSSYFDFASPPCIKFFFSKPHFRHFFNIGANLKFNFSKERKEKEIYPSASFVNSWYERINKALNEPVEGQRKMWFRLTWEHTGIS